MPLPHAACSHTDLAEQCSEVRATSRGCTLAATSWYAATATGDSFELHELADGRAPHPIAGENSPVALRKGQGSATALALIVAEYQRAEAFGWRA